MEPRTWMARFVPESCSCNGLFILVCTNQIIVNEEKVQLLTFPKNIKSCQNSILHT